MSMVEMQDSMQFDNDKDFKRGLGANKGINGTIESRSPGTQGVLQNANEADDGYERTSSGNYIAKMAEQSFNGPQAQSSAAYMMETATGPGVNKFNKKKSNRSSKRLSQAPEGQ